MENLADELQAIADEPEPDALEDFQAAGQRLVDALRDQFADGQAEALYSLQTAASQVRKHSQSIVSAAAAHTTALKQLTDQVVSRTTTEVSAGLQQILAGAHASIGEQLAAEVDASSTELRGAAQDHVQAISSQLEVTTNHLTALYDGVVARTQDARQGLEWVAAQGAEQLTAAVGSLEEHRLATEEAIAAAGLAMTDRLDETRMTLEAAADLVAQRVAASQESLSASADNLTEQVRAAGTGARADLAAGAEAAAASLRASLEGLLSHAAAARRELDDAMLEARKAAEDELVALRKQIQAAERREEAVAERLQKHVEDLVARTDATVTQSLSHLRGVADALLERDAQLEKRRADEFGRVLQTILSEGGASTRKLRDRIFRGMESAKAAPTVHLAAAPVADPVTDDSSPPEPQPAAERPSAPPKAPVRKTAAKASARKAPAKAPAAKKLPAKKAPAKKAAAAKPPAPVATSSDLPAITPVQEEQA